MLAALADVLRVRDGDRLRAVPPTRAWRSAVLEVGLGGRLDATNVVTPVAAAITSIDFDHQAQLGNDADVDRAREGAASSSLAFRSSAARCRPRPIV